MPTITREELYEAVWTTPLTKLARQFGVSDVAVAKACRKRAIPLPGLGHWAKIAAGHKVPRPPLPEKDPGKGAIAFSGLGDAKAKADALLERATKSQGAPATSVRVPERLGNPHPLTALTRQYLQDTRPDSSGNVHCRPPSGYDISISRGQVPRTLRILDTLVRELESRGAKVSFEKDERHMLATVVGEKLNFTLREVYDRAAKLQAERPATSSASAQTPRYMHARLGKLQIRIDVYTDTPVRRTWSDGRKPLEEVLGDVVTGFFVVGEAARERTQRLEEWHRQWEEERRRIEEEEQRQAEEQREFESLISEAKAWEDAVKVRNYVRALREAIERNESQLSAEGRAWLDATETRSARLDPLPERLRCICEETSLDGTSDHDIRG